LRDTEHGFRKGRSYLTNLLSFLNIISDCVDDGQNVDVFLDFAEAFDKVPHLRLSRKLISHGIDGKMKHWIDQWLSDRLQRVGPNGTTSSWKNLTSGLQQGSVLGPVLFLIYINERPIDDGISNWILKFADGTKMFAKLNDSQDAEVKTLEI